jgi:hypothetical protein
LREAKEQLKENKEGFKMRYQEGLVGNVFAEVYTGLETDASHPSRETLRMADLLRWTYGLPVTTNIPTDPLGQMVWLEKNIFEETRVFRKRDSWVLFTFRFLIKMDDWPACCVAVVRLALLRKKHPIYNQHEWDSFVAGLMDQYHQLDIDPLGQACFAYLCLTTSNPPVRMARNLPECLSRATFGAGVRIPELVLLLETESQDVASAHIGGSLTVVIVRREHQEAIFSKFASSWSFLHVEGLSRLWCYVNIHHNTLIAQVKQGICQRIQSKLAGVFERLGRPMR